MLEATGEKLENIRRSWRGPGGLWGTLEAPGLSWRPGAVAVSPQTTPCPLRGPSVPSASSQCHLGVFSVPSEAPLSPWWPLCVPTVP